MKLLFITHAFPPWNSIGAVRTSKTAKYLVEYGHKVKVISCKDQSLASNLPLAIPEHCVEYTSWWDINSPVELLLGGKKKVAAKGYYPSVSNLPNWILSSGIFYKNFLNFPDGQIGWYPFARQAGSRIINQWRPDLIFASAAPFTSLLVASALSRKHRIPWVAELRDLWVDNHNWVRPPWRYYFENLLEHHVLGSARGLVTVSNPLAETLRLKYRIPCEVITNGFDPEDYPSSVNVPHSNGIVHVTYTGQIFDLKRDPSPLFIALNKLGEDTEKIRVHFYGRYLELARNIAVKYKVEHLVKFHQPVSHLEAVKIQTQSDILLLLPGYTNEERGVFTGKLFEYLGARRPILCVGNTGGVAAELVRERAAGVTLTDPDMIAKQLSLWIKQKKDHGEIPSLHPKVGDGFTRKEQTEKLINFFERCLKNFDFISPGIGS